MNKVKGVLIWVSYLFSTLAPCEVFASKITKFNQDSIKMASFGAAVRKACFEKQILMPYEGKGRNYDSISDPFDFCMGSIQENGEATADYIINGSVNAVLRSVANQLVIATHFKNREFFEKNMSLFADACIGIFSRLDQAAAVNLDRVDLFVRWQKRMVKICSRYPMMAERDVPSIVLIYLKARAYGYPIDIMAQLGDEINQFGLAKYRDKENYRKGLEILAVNFYALGLKNYNSLSGDDISFGKTSEFRRAFLNGYRLARENDLSKVQGFFLSKSFDIASEYGLIELRKQIQDDLDKLISSTSSTFRWLQIFEVVFPAIVLLLYIWCLYIRRRFCINRKIRGLAFVTTLIQQVAFSHVDLFKALFSGRQTISMKERALLALVPLLLSHFGQSLLKSNDELFELRRAQYRAVGEK